MKNLMKLSTWLLVLVMTLSMSALADSGTENMLYSNSEYGFSMELPGDWILMDKSNVQSMMDMYISGDFEIEGIDEALLKTYTEQIETMKLVMAIAPDGLANINIITDDIGVELTADLYIKMMIPSVLEQIDSIYPGYTMEVEPCIASFGGNEYCILGISQEISGAMNHMLQAYFSVGTSMYCITLTCSLDADTGFELFKSILDTVIYE